MKRDVTISNHGSIFLLRPVTSRARAWFREHLDSDALWFAGAVVVEPRYVVPIVDELAEDGFIV
jgi:hypothetical protein